MPRIRLVRPGQYINRRSTWSYAVPLRDERQRAILQSSVEGVWLSLYHLGPGFRTINGVKGLSIINTPRATIEPASGNLILLLGPDDTDMLNIQEETETHIAFIEYLYNHDKRQNLEIEHVIQNTGRG